MITGFEGAPPKPQRKAKAAQKRIPRSKRPARVRQTVGGKAKAAADLKWAKAVRESGPCIVGRREIHWRHQGKIYVLVHSRCMGELQACHIVSRRYRATRTDPANGVPMCAWAHGWFTAHPLAWDAFVVKKIGRAKYEALKAKAQGRTE